MCISSEGVILADPRQAAQIVRFISASGRHELVAGPKSRIIEDRACNTSVGSNMEALREHGIVHSMSRPANPYENASCESFTGFTG
jgi:transposase InsO family protein